MQLQYYHKRNTHLSVDRVRAAQCTTQYRWHLL